MRKLIYGIVTALALALAGEFDFAEAQSCTMYTGVTQCGNFSSQTEIQQWAAADPCRSASFSGGIVHLNVNFVCRYGGPISSCGGFTDEIPAHVTPGPCFGGAPAGAVCSQITTTNCSDPACPAPKSCADPSRDNFCPCQDPCTGDQLPNLPVPTHP